MILLGNEAIVRGALESGVQFVSTYPGTPASEIGNIFYKIAKDNGVYFEFSVNEKVALEAGIGASFSGLKTLVAMKNFGLNVALDALLPFCYTGAKGPTVIIVADDPSCHSSAQSEENSRFIANASHIPVLEPSDPQECKDFVKLAFQISERYKIPVIVRTTTRVAHQRAIVKLGRLAPYRNEVSGAGFVKNPKQFVTLPPRVLEMKKELLDKITRLREFSEKSEINKVEAGNKSKTGIVASGVAYLYVKEALRELNLNLPILKLGFFYPLPKEKFKNFLKGLDKILVVEELEGYIEEVTFLLAKIANPKIKIFGKNLLPEVGELRPEIVISAIAKFTNKKIKTQSWKIGAPRRSPQLCPGCPYWLIISAIKKAVDVDKVIFGGEIGCYMLFGNSPVNLQDYLSCMGSSVGIAHGIKKALQQSSGQTSDQRIISFVGDSSFFHAGIPALINTVFNKSNPLIIILNNETTAMTGHQPHPVSVGVDVGINIENVVRACGVKNVKTIDPVNQEEFADTVKEFLEKPDASVIVAKHPCKFVAKK